ncbi:hypothetical protein LguiA_001007 [Lonicera macranthoides]
MGTEEKSPVSNNPIQRVKVYRMNDDGKWDDQGTGHVTVDYLERSEELGLFVIDEEDNETLLLHRIRSDDIYRKQEDTIISWRDPQYSTELALSFQETTGCSYIWDHISSVQRSQQFNTLNDETYHCVTGGLKQLPGQLPAVELSTLPIILKILVESGAADKLHLTDLILHDQGFFGKLMDLFRICEDLKNIGGLHLIFKIVRRIILLNSPQIFEKLFGDELIMDIIGSLEYDPEVPHIHHRNFLKEHVVFKEAIPIKDLLVLSKIHQTYRIGYLKDFVFPRAMDEATVASLNTIIHSNNAIVVSLLKDDSTFIQELFARLKSSTVSAESKKKLVFFLHEFCCLSKSLQMAQQIKLCRDLMSVGIFDIIADILRSEDKKLVLTGTDILILFLNQDPSLMRSYVTRQEGVPLLGLLVKGMITDFADDMHCQFLEILRSLLDSFTSGSQRDTIIEMFYEKHLGQLIDVITSSCPPNGAAQSVGKSAGSGGTIGSQISAKPEILLNICDLLCYCVLHHPYRIKCNFLLNNVIEKVLFLTRRREKYLVVAAVRFVRTLISRNDEHLTNHIVKNNLLKPIVDAFVVNGNRYNLLHSAVLELFEHIQKENLKILLKYLVDSFWDQLVQFENLGSIQSLKVRYEQSLENSGMKSTRNMLDSRKRTDERALEKEEEDYFNEESDEEDSASASLSKTKSVRSQPAFSNGSAASYPSSRSGGLVDYDDDEDDEDYKPPPRKQPEISNEDEETIESFGLKRKLAQKGEPELLKKHRLVKNPKGKNSVFAALCSTLSHAVLPSKKTLSSGPIVPRSSDSNKTSSEGNQEEKASVSCSSTDKETDNPRSCTSSLHGSKENRQPGRDDCPLIPPKSSPEMAVNGS